MRKSTTQLGVASQNLISPDSVAAFDRLLRIAAYAQILLDSLTDPKHRGLDAEPGEFRTERLGWFG